MSKIVDISLLPDHLNCDIIDYMFNTHKDYFKKKLKGVQAMIWDLEFKRFKTLYVREQIREEYDGVRSKLEIIKTRIASEKDKPTISVDEFKRLEDDVVRLNQEVERKVAQMKGLDIEITGAKPSAENPEGHQGLNETMEALRELMNVTKAYIKEL